MAVELPTWIGRVEAEQVDGPTVAVLLLTLTESRLRDLLTTAANGGDPETIIAMTVASARPLEDDE